MKAQSQEIAPQPTGSQILEMLSTDVEFVRWLLTLRLDDRCFDMGDPFNCAIAQWFKSMGVFSISVSTSSIDFRCQEEDEITIVECPKWAHDFQGHFLSSEWRMINGFTATPRNCLYYLRGDDYHELVAAVGKNWEVEDSAYLKN